MWNTKSLYQHLFTRTEMVTMVRTSGVVQGSVCSDLHVALDMDGADSALCKNPRELYVLASLLDRVVKRNEKQAPPRNRILSTQNSELTIFHGLRAPTISIVKYLERIFKYANCSPSCFVVAYAYIDRFIHLKPEISISSLNVHRLLITSVMLAAKFLDDRYYNNAHYAKAGGVSSWEMNRLELTFLFRLDFRLHVTVNVFTNYCTHMEQENAFVEGYWVERSLQFGCNSDEGSVQRKAAKDQITVVTREVRKHELITQQHAVYDERFVYARGCFTLPILKGLMGCCCRRPRHGGSAGDSSTTAGTEGSSATELSSTGDGGAPSQDINEDGEPRQRITEAGSRESEAMALDTKSFPKRFIHAVYNILMRLKAAQPESSSGKKLNSTDGGGAPSQDLTTSPMKGEELAEASAKRQYLPRMALSRCARGRSTNEDRETHAKMVINKAQPTASRALLW